MMARLLLVTAFVVFALWPVFHRRPPSPLWLLPRSLNAPSLCFLAPLAVPPSLRRRLPPPLPPFGLAGAGFSPSFRSAALWLASLLLCQAFCRACRVLRRVPPALASHCRVITPLLRCSPSCLPHRPCVCVSPARQPFVPPGASLPVHAIMLLPLALLSLLFPAGSLFWSAP